MPAHRGTSPRVREPNRPGCLLLRARLAEAGQERLPELLPAICPACRVVLGLVIVGGAILCRDCGVWADAADDLLGCMANG